jgi:hypothetical protein
MLSLIVQSTSASVAMVLPKIPAMYWPVAEIPNWYLPSAPTLIESPRVPCLLPEEDIVFAIKPSDEEAR